MHCRICLCLTGNLHGFIKRDSPLSGVVFLHSMPFLEDVVHATHCMIRLILDGVLGIFGVLKRVCIIRGESGCAGACVFALRLPCVL